MPNKTDNWGTIIQSMILPVILGLASGVCGGLIAHAYFTFSINQLPMAVSFGRSTSAITAPLHEVELAKRLGNFNLPVFSTLSVGPGSLENRIVLPENAVGMATVLTSDGWLLTHESVVRGQVLIGVDGKLKTPVKRVDDPRTGAVFLKIENGPLQVSGFEETQQMPSGTQLYAEDVERQFTEAFFSGASIDQEVRFSDAFSRHFTLDQEFEKEAYGGAVITVGGNLAGILSPDGFIPVHLLRPILSDAFRSQPLARGSLGVRYIDLGSAYISGESIGSSSGVRLASSAVRGLPAVTWGSAGYKAGLKEGDIILRVDDTELAGGVDLAEIIAEYRPDSKIRLEVLRGGERQFFEVELQ